jgi:hypothetical protein
MSDLHPFRSKIAIIIYGALSRPNLRLGIQYG